MGEDKNNNFAEFNCIIKTKKYTKEEDKKEVVVKEKEEVVIVKEEVVKEEVVIVKEHLKILLTKFNNVLFLSGAGTSCSAGYPLMKDLLKYLEKLDSLKQDIEKSLKYLEKLEYLEKLDSLKQDIEESLKYLEKLDSLNKKREELLKDLEKNKGPVKKIIKAAQKNMKEDNLEEILNKIDKEGDREKVEAQIVKILNIFEEICKKNPSKCNPHEMLIKKINSFLLNKYRFKIFTTNYDTLFEMACKKINYIVNDGFVFTDNSYNPLNFGYELIKNQHNDIIDYIPNLIHLYKLHGSLNWRKLEGDRVIKCSDENKNDKPVLIYPNKNKYEDSYNLPYLDMISEFNSALQQKDTLLIVCGYSFSDKHLNNIIERAFNSNNKIHLVIVDPCKLEDNKYYKQAKAYNNISMVECGFEKFVELLENKSDYMDESKNFYNKEDIRRIK
jgi:NAD-dependent SIR2 family protein deacetylase